MSVAYLTDTSSGQRYTLQKTETTIGRIDTCDIVIGQPKVSRQHAVIIQRGGNWFLRDLNSSNGVAVNGRQIPAGPEYPLYSGDVVTLAGIVGLRFEIQGANERPQYAADPFHTVAVQSDRTRAPQNDEQANAVQNYYSGAGNIQQNFAGLNSAASRASESASANAAYGRSNKTKKKTIIAAAAAGALLLLAVVILLLTNRKYTVVFDMNGGELISGELEQVVKKGESAVPPEVRNGRMALSWNGDYQNITGNTTITAEWTKQEMSSREIKKYVDERLVSITKDNLEFTGVIIDDQGLIATECNNMLRGGSLSVRTADGKNYSDVTIVDFDAPGDLILLRIGANDLPCLEIADETLETNDEVFAVSSSGNLSEGRILDANANYGTSDSYEISIHLNESFLGSALVNLYGELVGINTDSYYANKNLAIKIREFSRLDDDKNWSQTRYDQWLQEERINSLVSMYIDNDGNTQYQYTLTNTYWIVTDDPCRGSLDTDDSFHNGYRQLCKAYVHDYTSSGYRQYQQYLEDSGFEYLGSYRDEQHSTCNIYWNDVFLYSVDLIIDDDQSTVTVYSLAGSDAKEYLESEIAG